MLLRRVYLTMLNFYPAGFRSRFADEMVVVFEQAAAQHRNCGRIGFYLFAAREMLGLLAGAVRERLFQPNASVKLEPLGLSSDIPTAERYLETVSARLISAIANHDFANARYYDLEDRKARALLAQMKRDSF